MNKKINALIEESARLPEDSRRNNELVALLKQQDNSEVFDSVKKMIELRCPNALRIAKRTLNKKKYVKQFFWEGLSISDASTIKFWLDFALPKLGTRAVINILKDKEIEKAGTLGNALYFLLSLVNDEDQLLLKDLRN